ncbi:hypothetical protein OSTOST_14151 [Ostertagia ostertagi]
MSGYNMWYSYAVDHTFKQKSVYEAVRPCRLIIAQMSSHRCEIMNALLTGYAFVAGLSFCGP